MILSFVSTVLAADFDHVVIIVADDLGSDKVGAYAGDVQNADEDRPSTPNLDMLASVGVRFTDAWSNPMCSPTRAMLYSGEYAYHNGIGTVVKEGSTTRLGITSDSLAKLASDAGLQTALFGKWHVGETTTTPDAPTTRTLVYEEYPIQVGFDYFAGNMDGEVTSYTNWLYTVSKLGTKGTKYITTATTMTTSATDQTTDDAEAWMASNSSSRRLSVVSFGMPHATKSGGKWTWADAATSCGGTASSDEIANYKIAAECLDSELAELFAGIPDLDRTLVIFTGDNGSENSVSEGLFADGRGKGTVYENGVRVPFIFADGAALQAALDNGGTLPEGGSYTLDAGAVVSDPASVVDVYATIADLLDLSSSTCSIGSTCARDSTSLRDTLIGGAAVRDSSWTETFTTTSTGKYSGSAALRFGDYKLVVRVTAATSCRDYEMYDLAADRWETDDLFGDAAFADEQALLVSMLDEHAAQMTYAWLPSAECS